MCSTGQKGQKGQMSGQPCLSLGGTNRTLPYRGVCPVPLSSRLFAKTGQKAWCRPNAPVSVSDDRYSLNRMPEGYQ